MAGGMPPMGGPPPEDAGGKPPISGPLDSIGKILYDYDVEKEIASNPNRSEEELATAIWTEYGGSEDGGVIEGQIGTRDDSDEEKDPEQAKQDNLDTDDRKWVRLPRGKNISDITSIEELRGMMKDLVYGTIKKFKAPAAPPGGAPPGMPPMASRTDGSIMIRTSELTEMSDAVEKIRKRCRS